MSDHESDHELLTPEEAARYLRVNPQTVYRLLRAGGLPGVKVGRQWRGRRADPDARLAPRPPLGPVGPGEEAGAADEAT